MYIHTVLFVFSVETRSLLHVLTLVETLDIIFTKLTMANPVQRETSCVC